MMPARAAAGPAGAPRDHRPRPGRWLVPHRPAGSRPSMPSGARATRSCRSRRERRRPDEPRRRGQPLVAAAGVHGPLSPAGAAPAPSPTPGPARRVATAGRAPDSVISAVGGNGRSTLTGRSPWRRQRPARLSANGQARHICQTFIGIRGATDEIAVSHRATPASWANGAASGPSGLPAGRLRRLSRGYPRHRGPGRAGGRQCRDIQERRDLHRRLGDRRIRVLRYYRSCPWSFGNWQSGSLLDGPAAGESCSSQSRPTSRRNPATATHGSRPSPWGTR
jgi:hypothetical protein